jgi:lysozyme family protein
MDNLDRWNKASFTRSTQIEKQAAQIRANQSRYEAVSAKTGVPWDVIAVIHYRESSCSFAGVLHNGERIIGTGRKTTLVPKGRGPFATWEDAAFDALMNCSPYAGKNRDWSLGSTLDLLEGYNGLGYRKRGLPSPYLWAGTDQYTSGKYVADGKFDPNVVDQQLGAAAILIALRGKGNTQPAQTPPVDATQPPAPKPAGASTAPSVAKVAVPTAVVAAGGLYVYWHEITHWFWSVF